MTRTMTAALALFGLVSIAAAQQPKVKKSHISIFDLKTGKAKVIYSADKLIEAPNWSPDGKSLLVNTGGDLYLLPVDAPEPALQKIDLGAYGKCNNDKTFSPDGKLIALSSSAKAKGSQVYTVPAVGGQPKLIVPETPSYFHGFSPDGKWMAIVAQRNKNFDLFRVPTVGGEQQRLTSHSGYDDGPDYSPDGKWIYFNSNRSDGWDIWRMPAAGAGAEDAQAARITSDDKEDWFPHPSPDGKKIVFLSFPKGTAGHDGRLLVELRMISAPGAKVKKVSPRTLHQFFGGQGSINVNSWSPDSKRFAFVAYEQ